MRDYNPATDYPILEAAAREEHTLVCARRHLEAAGINWPQEFYKNNSSAAQAIDKDICRSWGR